MSLEFSQNLISLSASPRSISGSGKSMRTSMAPSTSINSLSCTKDAFSIRHGSSPEISSISFSSLCMIWPAEEKSLLRTPCSWSTSDTQNNFKSTYETFSNKDKKLKTDNSAKYFSKNTCDKWEGETWRSDKIFKSNEKPLQKSNLPNRNRIDNYKAV